MGTWEPLRYRVKPGEASEASTLTSPAQAEEADSSQLLMEPRKRTEVVRKAVVGVVATEHACIPAMLIYKRFMHAPPRLFANFRQLTCDSFALRLMLHDVPSVSSPPTVVSEPEEREGTGSG